METESAAFLKPTWKGSRWQKYVFGLPLLTIPEKEAEKVRYRTEGVGSHQQMKDFNKYLGNRGELTNGMGREAEV